MKKQLNPSGMFSLDFHHYNFFKRSRLMCEKETLNLINSRTGSSSCQCSTTSIGRRNETMEFVFRIQKKSRNTLEEILAGTQDVHRSWRLRKWYGTFSYTLEGKRDSTATQMVERFKDTCHPVFKSISALSCGILKKKEWQRHQHFNADASNTDLLFRIIHSVRIGVNNSVSQEERGWERPVGKKESVTKVVLTSGKSQEVKLVVSLQKWFLEAVCGKSIQDSESLSETIRLTRVSKAHRSGTGYRLYELQYQTWQGLRFWRSHPSLSRRHVFSSKPTIQSLSSASQLQQPTQWDGALSQSHPGLCGTIVGPGKDTHGTPVPLRRKAVGGPTNKHHATRPYSVTFLVTNRTSHWSSDRKNSWPTWARNCNSITQRQGTDILFFDFQRKESVFPMPNLDPVQNYSLNFKNLKEENLAWDSRIPATRRLVRPMFQVMLAMKRIVQTHTAFLPALRPSSRKEPTERKWKVIPA